jgi:hypothetical protein
MTGTATFQQNVVIAQPSTNLEEMESQTMVRRHSGTALAQIKDKSLMLKDNTKAVT